MNLKFIECIFHHSDEAFEEKEEESEDENVGQICLNNPIIGNSIKISLRKSFSRSGLIESFFSWL